MSAYDMLDHLAVKMPCEFCSVGSGRWCRTASGALARLLHGKRIDPVYRLLAQSYLEGERDGLAYAQRRPESVDKYLAMVEKNLAAAEVQ
jgi:hypothetical protein